MKGRVARPSFCLGGAFYASIPVPVKSTLVDFAPTKVGENVPTGTLRGRVAQPLISLLL